MQFFFTKTIDNSTYLCYNIFCCLFAPVAELADALDLGSSVPDVKVQVLSGAPYIFKEPRIMRGFFDAIFNYSSHNASFQIYI